MVVVSKLIRFGGEIARSERAEHKEKAEVTETDKGSDKHLDGRRRQHAESGIVNKRHE